MEILPTYPPAPDLSDELRFWVADMVQRRRWATLAMLQELQWIPECEHGNLEGLVTTKEATDQGSCHAIKAHKPRKDSVLANYVNSHSKILHHSNYRCAIMKLWQTLWLSLFSFTKYLFHPWAGPRIAPLSCWCLCRIGPEAWAVAHGDSIVSFSRAFFLGFLRKLSLDKDQF